MSDSRTHWLLLINAALGSFLAGHGEPHLCGIDADDSERLIRRCAERRKAPFQKAKDDQNLS